MTIKDLQGRVVAVTGGARGIGAATAKAFAARGASVAIGDVDTELVQKTAAQIAETTGARVIGLSLDVTQTATFEAFLASVESEFGGLDVLVNNAGIMPTGEFLSESDSVSDRQIDINVRGVVIGSKLAGRRFAARGDGHIINIASVAGLAAPPGVAVYGATKYAVVGLGNALQQELAPKGIRVTTIAPGFVNTELIAGLSPNAVVRRIGYVEPERIAAVIVNSVIGRKTGLRVVPWVGGALLNAMSPLPLNLKNSIAKLFGLSSVTLHADESARAAYRARIEQRATGHENSRA